MSDTHLETLTEAEQEHLRDALQRLLTSGAIFREEHRDLYDWCRIQRMRLDLLSNLIGLKLHWDQELRLIFALPQSSKLLRKLKQDETLLALALWYDFDRAVKDEGKTLDDVSFTVRTFNENLATKFKDMKLPQSTRMRDILALFERKSLIRLRETANADGLADVVIHVLPTIRLVIPFPSLDEWQRQRDRHVQAAGEPEEVNDETQD
jgi:Domain of unknown function (DUF4194)